MSDNNNERSQQNNLVRFLAHLPCVPSSDPMPDTPNIDKIKEILTRFRSQDNESTNVSIVDRIDANELCQMSQSILKFLPSVNDAPSDETNNVVSHFNAIKRFYTAYQNAGFDPSVEMETFFNSLQIYESVMSIAFVFFHEHPTVMSSISDNVTKAIEKIDGYKTKGCLAITFCGLAFLSKFNTILAEIDKKIGEIGVVKVAEFVAEMIEVFCRFFNIDLKDTNKITALSESIQDLVKTISNTLRSIFGDTNIPDHERKKKWGPLDITERIRAKLSKFEQQSAIVNRTVNSFERFFKSVEKIDDNLEMLTNNNSRQTVNLQRSAPTDDVVEADQIQLEDDDYKKVEANPVLARQIADENLSALEQVTAIGRFFQHLETILSYGVLIFKNEDEVLNPLLDNVDECTRVLEKYSALHPLYKIICGRNYLSKLKVIVKKIVALLENSNLKINSPREFLSELKQKYPNLLIILGESLVNDKIKKKLEFLPDGIENAMNDALDGALSKFKNKFKF